MTVLLHACYRLPLSEEACFVLGMTSLVAAVIGCVVVVWWVGR